MIVEARGDATDPLGVLPPMAFGGLVAATIQEALALCIHLPSKRWPARIPAAGLDKNKSADRLRV